MMPREQKITPEALAILFQDRYAASAAKHGFNEWDRPKPWADIPAARRALLTDVFGQLLGLFIDEADPGTIWVSSIVSHKTHEGLVQVQFGGTGGQVPPEDARQIAHQFLEAAEAAESDSIIWEIFRGHESPQNELMAVNMIVTMRDLREKRRIAQAEKGNPPK